MEIATSIMLTAAALYSEAETPIGTVGFLATDDMADIAAEKEEMRQSVAGTFEEFEAIEMQRGSNQREALQLGMLNLAKQYDT